MKLTNEEIKYINNLKFINLKKNFIQNKIIQEWKKNDYKGVFTAYTGMGKSRVISSSIKLINKEFPEYNIIILSPTNKLEQDFNNLISEFNLKNTTSSTIQSFIKKTKEGVVTDYEAIFIDECHWTSNDTSMFFSKILPNTEFKMFMGCTATLEKSNRDYYSNLNIPLFFEVDGSDGYRMGLVPDISIFCVGVNFTEEEKKEYVKLQKEYDNLISFFSQYDVSKPVQCIFSVVQKKGVKINYNGSYTTSDEHAKVISEALDVPKYTIIGLGMKWMGIVNKRATLLNNATNLFKGAVYILNNIIPDNCLVFCPTIENAGDLSEVVPNSLEYHSKISKKKREQNIKKFENKEVKNLLTIKALDQGYNLENLRYGLQYSYTSKKLQFVQRAGRLWRFDKNNPDKQSFFVCLYIDDFKWEDKLITSQQKVWLRNSMKNQSFVEWTDINQLKQLLK